MLPLVHAATYYCRQRGVVIVIGLLAGDAAAYFSARGHVHGLYQWIGMFDTGMMMAFAVPTLIGAAWLVGANQRIARALAVMWLTLAAFHFSFTRNIGSALSHRLAYVVPTTVVSIGCLWIARIDGGKTS